MIKDECPTWLNSQYFTFCSLSNYIEYFQPRKADEGKRWKFKIFKDSITCKGGFSGFRSIVFHRISNDFLTKKQMFGNSK